MSNAQPHTIESQGKSYKIIETLGEGGTSIVYLANDGTRSVALKILGEEVEPIFKDRYVQILKNEFEVYIHKSLTRKIVVLESNAHKT